MDLPLTYDPHTGEFRWARRVGNRPAGSIAGRLNLKGYRRVTFLGVTYLLHRVAFSLCNKDKPLPNEVDHKDGKRDHNACHNLRPATRRSNAQNLGVHREGKRVGATYRKGEKVWVAQISCQGKNKHLGRFATEDEAVSRYWEEVKRGC